MTIPSSALNSKLPTYMVQFSKRSLNIKDHIVLITI